MSPVLRSGLFSFPFPFPFPFPVLPGHAETRRENAMILKRNENGFLHSLGHSALTAFGNGNGNGNVYG
jgi:hypothetical protein